MAELCGIIGIGQTKHDTARKDVSIPGLVREAALRALEDAGMTFADIDAVVLGKAPDTFEGVMMPELYLAEALGAVGKPALRVHTAGSVGGSTGLVAASLIQSGVHQKVLTVAFEKQSESEAMWALSPKIPFQPPLLAGAGGYFGPLNRSYIERSGAPDEVGVQVAVKDRENAGRNPYAHLRTPLTHDEVRGSPMLWDPVRYLETCPSSDGAVAMVLASESVSDKVGRDVAWVQAGQMRSEPTLFAGRDEVLPKAGADCARALYAQAGITNPRKELDMAELYVPFSWFEPMWLENLHFAERNKGWELTAEGATSMEGDIPINCSGGVLATNPIGASGLLRFAEAALQVRGRAGEHQVDGARRAMGHAYGGGSQYFAMWIVGSEKP